MSNPRQPATSNAAAKALSTPVARPAATIDNFPQQRHFVSMTPTCAPVFVLSLLE
ncbi:hypothetical protein [Pseudomonas baetica]|uniref:hypothetical protein n=1 Tax=Pseudomonas baetica TaxID=674054 RepID=UPI0035B4FE8A